MWKKSRWGLKELAQLYKASIFAIVSMIDATSLLYSRIVITIVIALSILAYVLTGLYKEWRYKPIYNALHKDTEYALLIQRLTRMQPTQRPIPHYPSERVTTQITQD